MSGLGGHINQIFENLDLSFYHLKKILREITKGNIVLSEKTDGYNNYISINNENEIVFARNKTDIINGGLNEQKLYSRLYAGGDRAKRAYIFAYLLLNNFFSNISNINKYFYTPDGNQIWWNTEILGPIACNVIHYDHNQVVIHPRNHKLFSKSNGITEIPFNEVKVYQKLLEKCISSSKTINSAQYITINHDLSHALNIALLKIDKEITTAGLTDQNTIQDLLLIPLAELVKNYLPTTIDELKDNICQNYIGKAKLSLPKGTPMQIRNIISSLRKPAKELMVETIKPIEKAIHEFGIDLLTGLKSAYIGDNLSEIERIKKDLRKTINQIKIKYNNSISMMDFLQTQLNKIGDINNINTTIEGVVFDFNDKTYKITGLFAPINQINGILQYEKKPVQKPKIKPTNSTIALFPGSFKPPHKGHYQALMQLMKKSGANHGIVIISPKERASHNTSNRISINSAMSKRIWEIFTENNDNILIKVAKNYTPIVDVYDYLSETDQNNKIYLGVGDKDKASSRYANIPEWLKTKNLQVETNIEYLPSIISSTELRTNIVEGNQTQFMSGMPEHLSSEQLAEVWSIIISENNYQDKVASYHEKRKEELIGQGDQENTLPFSLKSTKKRSKSAPPIGETSSMGGGSISGASGVSKRKQEDDELIIQEIINNIKLA